MEHRNWFFKALNKTFDAEAAAAAAGRGMRQKPLIGE